MLRAVFRNSRVLRSSLLLSATTSGVGAASAAQQQHAAAAEADASSTAAALWNQASVHSSLSADNSAAAAVNANASHQHHAYDAGEYETLSSYSADAARVSSNTGSGNNAHEGQLHNGGGGYVCLSGGFGSRELAEVATVPPGHAAPEANGGNRANDAVEAAEVGDDARPSSSSGRPVITKARRIRLAAAASQAAEVLQAVGSPATALLHSQRVQQLQAEEALLNASLQRLKAERDLAKVRHTYDEERQNFQRGVEHRERDVLLATHPRRGKKGSAQVAAAAITKPDPMVSYSQESGGGVVGLGEAYLDAMTEADLLGMTATADAEAAVAAAAAAAKPGRKPGTSRKPAKVTSASAKLRRQRRTTPKKRNVATAALPMKAFKAKGAKAPLRMKVKAAKTRAAKASLLKKKKTKSASVSSKAKAKAAARRKVAPATSKNHKGEQKREVSAKGQQQQQKNKSKARSPRKPAAKPHKASTPKNTKPSARKSKKSGKK